MKTYVKHKDGSTGQVLDAINGTPAGEDATGAWAIPVAWLTGPRSRGLLERSFVSVEMCEEIPGVN